MTLIRILWSYYDLLQINPIVFDAHLVVILQTPLINKSLIMNVHEVYNLPILDPTVQTHFSLFFGG